MDALQRGAAHESSLSRGARKADGVFYTPPFIVSYILERALAPRLERCASLDEVLRLKVYDPSCGAGFFLIAAFERLVARIEALEGRCPPKVRELVQAHCLFGADIDAKALAIARRALPWARLERTDSLSARNPLAREKFDVVVGNPPYGAETDRSGDSAAHFIRHALSALAAGGSHAFIVPKPVIYSSSWSGVREELLPGLAELADCGRVWDEVRLEQVIYVYRREEGPHYLSLVREGASFRELGELPKSVCAEFGFALNGITPEELALGRKLRAAGAFLHDHVTNQRGAPLQAELSGRASPNSLPAYGGKQIARYASAATPKGFLPRTAARDPRAVIAPKAILAQNIVAHLTKPEGHLKLMATLSSGYEGGLVLDTVNQLRVTSGLEPEVLLAILNSKLMAWYIYRFVVGRAVRTIHLDTPVTSKIPLPRSITRRHREALTRLVRQQLEKPEAATEAEIDRLVCLIFGLGGKGWRGQ